MTLLKHLKSAPISFLPNRAIFQGVDAAPPAPESFKGPEKQSQQDAVNEVAQQSPSQIMSSAMTHAAAVKTKYVANTQILAAIIKQPISAPLTSNANGPQPTNNEQKN